MSDQHKGLDRTAYEIRSDEKYVPYETQNGIAEFTIKAVVSGVVLGVLFGAANTYLGLMAGLTISTSIPVAVLTVVLFGTLKAALGIRHTILEANLSQTIGSASSSVASGVLFTIPALFIWGQYPSLAQLTLLAMAGGLIGVLFMIPLRAYLIQREHGKLPYPEGVACAEVLVASKEGGRQAAGVFWGLGVGAAFKLLTDGLKLIRTPFEIGYWKVSLAIKVSPALIGVGFILGPRIASVMVAGSALSAFVIIPVIALWGHSASEPFYPETEKLIRDMTADAMREQYIRFIGAGAVGAAGIMTLIRSLPVMIRSFGLALGNLSSHRDSGPSSRTDHDLPPILIGLLLVGVLAILVLVPGILGFLDSIAMRAVAAVLIAIAAFFFVTVASRIVGMVGVTSNPTSGMTIATLLGTSLIFLALGWTDMAGKATALMVGTAVCIAASIAGDTSQDLKTGFLLGATPWKQQVGELIGVITCAIFVCLTVMALDRSPGIGMGEGQLPAPQAQLMNVVIGGVIDQNLPWMLILIGMGIAMVAGLLRLPPLPFSVGVYLPLSTMAAVFLGGLLQWFLTRRRPEAGQVRKQGVLFGSGLVGGEGLMGVAVAVVVLISGRKITGFPPDVPSWATTSISLAAICGVLCCIAFFARRHAPEAAGTNHADS